VKKAIFAILLLAMILASNLGMGIVIRPLMAQDGRENVPSRDFLGKTIENTFSNKPANSGILESSSRSLLSNCDKWSFNDSNEWSKFIFADSNKTRLIIGVDGEKPTSLVELEKIAAKHEARVVDTVSIGGDVRALVVELLLGSVTAFVEEVHSVGLASYMEPNMKVQAQLVPNDPYWSVQWGAQKIEADWAWNTTVGNHSVLVAVIDTGICYTHPDLAANYVPLGYDWVNNDADPMDDNGHGTHCAGIIAAVINNGEGIAGLAQVQVMAEKVLDSSGQGYVDWIANGIVNATDCGARIISMSLGGYGYSQLLYDAVKYAYDKGVLVVAAAGNDNTNTKMYSAGYDEVIAVAATDQDDNKAWFSNWGDWIELSAPGVDIYSAVPSGYEYMSGTSMACPHVAGVAALAWSLYPNKTRDWVREWLRYTADDLGDPGFDLYYGYGRVNARKAAEQAAPAHELIAYGWATPPYFEPGASGTINATVLNFGGGDETDVAVELLANNTGIGSTVIGLLASGNSVSVGFTWSPVAQGLYNVTLCVEPVPGETSLENNVLWKYIYVGFPVKAVVLRSAGNIDGNIITNWQVLSNEWSLFGDIMVYIDHTTLNKENITYEDIAATEADVLIISCACDPYEGWQFTDPEIEAIKQYVFEGHGLIVTSGTFYYMVPNNNKLAALLGLNETIGWGATGTDLLHVLNTTHPIFTNVPNPLVFPQIATVLPSDGRWDSNELVGGKYLALGHYQESAIVTFRGLVYISPLLEIVPAYYHHHLQLLYNAIIWSRYQRPQHDLAVSLQCPTHLHPGGSVLVNATVENLGLNNETNVGLLLLVDGGQVANLTVPTLGVGESRALSYVWSPALGTYNVTAYAPPVLGEGETFNNVKTILLKVSYAAVIGFIETHGESLHSDDLKVYYQSLGHIVDTIYSPLTSELLAGYDVLMVGEDWSNTPWSSSEIEAVQSFISSGKGFVAVGDELASSVQTILVAYGIAYTNYYGDPGPSNNFDHSHPIMEGVNYIYSSYPVNSLQTVPPGYWIANDVSNMHVLIAGAEAGGYVLCLSDDFASDLYAYDNMMMFTNIISWMVFRYEHDLAVSLVAPTILALGNSAWLNATVRNRGLNAETDVELYLMINGTTIGSDTILELPVGGFDVITYLWTPTVAATYNVTAYVPPVLGENVSANNFVSKMVLVRYQPRLLVVDTPGPEDTGALDTLGYEYTLVTPSEFATVDLYGYNILFIGWAPGDGLVDVLLARAPDIANWVAAGNGIVALAESYEANRWAWLPLFVNSSGFGGDEVHILDPSHPVMSNLTDTELSYWGSSYHGYFFGYDPSWENLAEGIEAAQPVTIAAMYGAGRIVITEQDPDFHFYYGGQEGAGKLLRNMIEWTAPTRREHDLAVSLQAPASLELGNLTLLNATVRNVGLNNETRVELYLLINSSAVNSMTNLTILQGESATITFLWTPTETRKYNITAYAPPVSGEEEIGNNNVTKSVNVFLYTRMYLTHRWVGEGAPMGWHADDASWQYTLLFDFPFYGICYRTIYISSNGLITFTSPDSSYSNSVPALAGKLAIAPAWDDWVTYEPYDIYAWQNSTHAGIRWYVRSIGSAIVADFEAILNVDGTIQFNYVFNNGTISATIGISNGINRILAEDVTSLNCNRSILFLPYRVEHDVAVTNVTPFAYQVLIGESVDITVVAENQGMISESFNVTLYASPSNSTPAETHPIGVMPVVDLSAEANISLTFTWSTANFTAHDYVIWAAADIIPGEIVTDNNVCYDGTVKIVKAPVATFTYSPVPATENIPVTFDASNSTPNGGYLTSFTWDFKDGNVTTTADPVIAHAYSSHGTYDVTLTVMDSEGLTNSTWRLVEVWRHDVAIIDVVSDRTWAFQGFTVNLNVTILNKGDLGENVNVTLYYNVTSNKVIGTQNMTLSSGQSQTIIFVWNTTGVPYCRNYTMTAVATIPADSNPADNTLSKGDIEVRILGDINGDGTIDMKDIRRVAKAFASYPGHPRWSLDADLNQDGIVDMKDIRLVAKNFGLSGFP
jgi:thermitase